MVSVFPCFRAEGGGAGCYIVSVFRAAGEEQKLFPSPAVAPSDALTLEAQVLTCCFSNPTLWFSLPRASAIPPFLSLKSFGSL